MLPAKRETMTEAAYLALDEASAERYEYYAGEIVLMAGAEPVHGALVADLVTALRVGLRGRPFMVWAESQRVRIVETDLYAYPDVVATSGRPEFADTRPQTLLNPLLVIEVLSPSTETDDRGAKFAHYQRRASLREYVLVTPEKRRVEHYQRLDDDRWLLSVYTGDDVLVLPAVELEIPLADIYAQAELLASLTADA